MAKRFSAPKQSVGRGSAQAVPRSLVILTILSLVICIIGFTEGDSGILHSARGVFQIVATPVRFVGAVVTSPVQGIGTVFTNLTASSDSLSDLQAENESLKGQVAQLSEYEHDVDTLTGLLELRSTHNLASTAARVVAQSNDSWTSTITIDKGSSAGLAVGMPVTSEAGVIGQISECGPTSSSVRLISDEKSGVSALVQSSRAQGQLVGSPDASLHLTMVRTDQQVSVGDSVVTSGLGGVYPKGLPIGSISIVTKAPGALYYDITVKPLSNAPNLEEVLVITAVREDQQGTPEDARAADNQDRTTSSASTQITPVPQTSASTQ